MTSNTAYTFLFFIFTSNVWCTTLEGATGSPLGDFVRTFLSAYTALQTNGETTKTYSTSSKERDIELKKQVNSYSEFTKKPDTDSEEAQEKRYNDLLKQEKDSLTYKKALLHKTISQHNITILTTPKTTKPHRPPNNPRKRQDTSHYQRNR